MSGRSTGTTCAVLVALLMLAPQHPGLRAHEGHALEEDVVCGMKIKREEAAGQTDLQGQTFYFCSKEDLATFKANPDRYAGFLALTRVVDGRTYQMAVKPRRPQAGDELTLTLTLPERRWITGVPRSGATTAPLEALFFDLSPAHEEIARSHLHMPPGSSPGVYTMGRYFREAGIVRLVVLVPRSVGVDKVPFGFDVGARETPAPEPAPMGRPAPAALSMEAQHETMRVMGRAWYDLFDELDRPEPRWDEALSLANRIAVMAGRLPGFELHKFPKEKPEFLKYGQELAGALESNRRLVESRARDQARFEDVARVSGSQLAPGSRRVTYYSIGLSTPTTGASPTFVMFGTATLAGTSVPLALAVDGTDRIGAVKTYPRVVLHHRGATLRHAVDRFLASLAGREVLGTAVPAGLPEELSSVAPPLIDTLSQMGYLLREARAQKNADDREGEARRRELVESPDRLAVGERLFLQGCAACHGPTGKGALVPGALADLRSRNLSDGAHLNRRSDESLLFLFRQGGEKARLSSSMPGFGSVFDDTQLKSILDHVRSLARPRKETARAP